MHLKNVAHILFLLASVSAFASDQDSDPCNDEGGGVTAGYLCIAQKNKIADEELNLEYQEALKRTQAEEAALRVNWPQTELVTLFRESQRAWLKFRDAECKFIGTSSTPSPWQGVQVEECIFRMARDRIKYFKGVHSG